MKHVSILVPLGHTSMANIDGTHQILSQVNSFMADRGKPPLFNIQLVGVACPTIQRNGLFTIEPETLIGNVAKTDLIIIPAMHGDIRAALELNKDFAPWVIAQNKNGAEVASFCIGAFFLAYTGLLNGKQAATHWSLANVFRQMYPDVHLVDDKILTED